MTEKTHKQWERRMSREVQVEELSGEMPRGRGLRGSRWWAKREQREKPTATEMSQAHGTFQSLLRAKH
jgi:hypothetical protein